LTVREQLERLVRLQGVVQEVRSAREFVESAPARIGEIEARFRERNAAYVAIQERHDALQEDQRARSDELLTLETSKKKYMTDLMAVQNQREYAAILREIDAVKARIGEHEEAVLKDMEEIESVKVELELHAEHIRTERELVDRERAEVEAGVERARGAVAQREAERESIEAELPAALVSSVRRLVDNRQGQFLSQVVDGICQSCFVRLRPQGFQEVKLVLRLHYCSNCRRLLYHEPSLHAGTAGGSAPGPVEAVDGGAV
jgi:predicted  nucleic acid-binding Zn-ribbon protein